MKQTINFNQFHDAFHNMNRGDNFTYDGLRALFDYLEQCEEETDYEMELDVIALCCEFTEYKNLAEFQGDYGDGLETVEDISGNTTVIPIGDNPEEDGFVIQDF